MTAEREGQSTISESQCLGVAVPHPIWPTVGIPMNHFETPSPLEKLDQQLGET